MLSCKVDFNDMLQNPETGVTSWMRIFKIDGDPKRIWVQAGYQMDNGGWYESDDIELSNKILEALAAHNYRVVVLEGTTPTEYFTAEQLEVLYSEFYVEKTIPDVKKPTAEEIIDREVEEIERKTREEAEGLSFEEIMALLQAEDTEAMRSDLKNDDNSNNSDGHNDHDDPSKPSEPDNHDEPEPKPQPEDQEEP